MLDREGAINLSRIYRSQRQRLVLTNGCFDLLHVGHIRLLETARALGNILVVGLNSDASVRRLKGCQRPVVCEEERAEVLIALRYVNHVVIFNEDTASSLIQDLAPDVYVKGGDYDLESVPEALTVKQFGGQVAILPYTSGRSTTALLQAGNGNPQQQNNAEPPGGAEEE